MLVLIIGGWSRSDPRQGCQWRSPNDECRRNAECPNGLPGRVIPVSAVSWRAEDCRLLPALRLKQVIVEAVVSTVLSRALRRYPVGKRVGVKISVIT
jgi:hypothetical protein